MILKWLERAATDRPDHPFIVEGAVAHSFADIADRVDGTTLRAPDPITPLAMAPRTDTIVQLLGLWNSGTAVLPTPEGGTVALPLGMAEPGDALVMATSGSTGRPKLVRLTFDNLAASAAASAEHLAHSPDERWLCNLPLHHIGGLSIIVRSLREATTVLLEPSFDAPRTAQLLHSGDATIGSLVATTLRRTLEAGGASGYRCRAVLVGGGPVPESLVDESLASGIPALPTYGMTETASQIATASEPGGPLVPLPNVRIRCTGDVVEVAGPMVSPGYLGEPERAGEWFATSDLGRIDHNELVITGRADSVIISGGEKVNPEQVEEVLRQVPGIDEVCVVGVPDPRWGEQVVAVYAGTDRPDERTALVRDLLAPHEIPRRWTRVPALPKTALDKIDRHAVQNLAANP